MRVMNEAIVTNGDMSAASITSSMVSINQAFGFSIQGVMTGGPPTGTAKLQGSCDPFVDLTGTGVTNWTDITGSSVAIAAAGTFLYNVVDCEYNWVRLVYTRTAGSGTLNVRINVKGF